MTFEKFGNRELFYGAEEMPVSSNSILLQFRIMPVDAWKATCFFNKYCGGTFVCEKTHPEAPIDEVSYGGHVAGAFIRVN